MKFGKTLLSQQLPEYSAHYINYKSLKKVIKSLAAGSENETLLDEHGRSQTRIQANRATFFFKLERELDKVNAFYLQKEAELRNRLNTLLDKKRYLQTGTSSNLRLSPNFMVLREGFQQFERDLNKLQQYVELNATGFYKALKKWDKRSKSHTKELYLSRRVEIQPVFNRDVLSNLVDTATSVLLELDGHANGDEPRATEQRSPDLRAITSRAEDELDSEMLKVLASPAGIQDFQEVLNLYTSKLSGKESARITCIFMQAIVSASEISLNAVVATGMVDFSYEDEISGRTCIHEAVLASKIHVIKLCLTAHSDLAKTDVYGRTPLHYACMSNSDSSNVLEILLQNNAPVNVLDHNMSSPLHYAIINGNISHVDLLLRYKAQVNTGTESDYIPLSIACARGHLNITKLLLNHGANIVYNSEGLLPSHLVARAGHPGFCSILFRNEADVEVRDKFNGWTPIFFAASEGHVAVLKELLACGAQVDVRDDEQHSPTYYAAWEGHQEALGVLLAAGGGFGNTESHFNRTVEDETNPVKRLTLDSEDDLIPSLLLPPPILPIRSYGHNYLDKTTFVQINLVAMEESSTKSPVLWYLDESLFSSSKLTISLKSVKRNDTSELIPHTVSLPITDESETFTFQIDSLEGLSLEFEIYPTFGSKVIAKGVVAPSVLRNVSTSRANGGRLIVPLLDPRLQSIGQVSFEYIVIDPLPGLHLDIHSRIETYWKSTQTITAGKAKAQAQHLVTQSSLSGQYVWIPIQVTSDNIAFVCPTWYLPESHLKIGIAQVDSAVFEAVCSTARDKTISQRAISEAHTSEALRLSIQSSFIKLSEFLSLVDENLKLHLQVILPTISEQEFLGAPMTADVNIIVDTILTTVFEHSSISKAGPGPRKPRSILFSASNTSICTALNWKQPNYPVFLAYHLGPDPAHGSSQYNTHKSSPHGLAVHNTDHRCSSIKEAVKFSKVNNLLGLMVDAEIALHAPALISTIKGSGLVLVTHGSMNSNQVHVEAQSLHGVDAIQTNGVCRFLTQINM